MVGGGVVTWLGGVDEWVGFVGGGAAVLWYEPWPYTGPAGVVGVT